MGLYTYYNVNNEGEKKDFFFHMKDSKPDLIKENNIEWKRDWSSIRVQGRVDGNWNPNSEENWLDQTKKRKGSMADLWSQSAELSEKRTKERGYEDPKVKTYKENWSKQRRGKQCPDGVFIQNKDKSEQILEI